MWVLHCQTHNLLDLYTELFIKQINMSLHFVNFFSSHEPTCHRACGKLRLGSLRYQTQGQRIPATEPTLWLVWKRIPGPLGLEGGRRRRFLGRVELDQQSLAEHRSNILIGFKIGKLNKLLQITNQPKGPIL